MIARLLLALAIALAASSGAEARNRQLANIVYEPPANWEPGRLRDEGWLTLLNRRDDERCEFCYIHIHLGTPAKGSFKHWMRRKMKLVLDDNRKLKDVTSKTFTKRRLGKIHMRSRLVKRNGKRLQVFLGFELGDRFEMIHFEGEAGDADEMKDTQAALTEEFLPMLNRLGFVSMGKKPVIGKPKPGDLDGVWFGSRIDYGVNFDATMRMDVRPVIFTFYRDGRFFEGVPPSGMSAFDYDAAVLTTTPKIGNYILKKTELRLFYADGDRETLERDGDTFKDGNATLTKMRLPEDGFRFEGSLSNFDYHPFAPGISGGVATSSDWVFSKDGNYTTDKFVGASGNFDSGGGFTTYSDDAPKKGRYEIADGVIRLTPPKGKGDTKVWPFFLRKIEGDWQPIIRGEFLEQLK